MPPKNEELANNVLALLGTPFHPKRPQIFTEWGEKKHLEAFGPASGGAMKITDAEPIVPKAHEEVIVAVFTSGVDWTQGLMIEDKYQFKPRLPFTPGERVPVADLAQINHLCSHVCCH